MNERKGGCGTALLAARRWLAAAPPSPPHPRRLHQPPCSLEGGWYPAPIGPGNAAAKGRIPFAVLALLETLRAFPGQVGRRQLRRLQGREAREAPLGSLA
jgi:hypothetical protein